MKRQPRLDSTSPPPRRGRRPERGRQGPPPPPPPASASSERHVDDENKKEQQQQQQQLMLAVRQSWIESTATQSGGRHRTGLLRARVTPWTGWEELDEVGRNLMLVLVDRNEDPHRPDSRSSSEAPNAAAAAAAPAALTTAPRGDDDENASAPLPPRSPHGDSASPVHAHANDDVGEPAGEAKDNPEGETVVDDHCDSVQKQEQSTLDGRAVLVQGAIDRVEIWRVRAGGGSGLLPHAVESTHALALCLHHDQQQQQQRWDAAATTDSTSSSSLALQYGSAITRTVNGLTDMLQQSRSVACSVSHLAQLLGMPNWVVDVRHQSTHNALPSLPTLRSAARTLLLYLDQVYWTPLRHKRWKSIELARQLLLEQQSDQGTSRGSFNDGGDDLRIMDEDEDRLEYDDNGDDEDYNSSEVDDLGEDDDNEGDNDDDEGVHVASRGAVSLPHKVLGTTFNRFAALLDDSASKSRKAKKKEAAAAQTETAESSSTTQESTSAARPGNSSSSSPPQTPRPPVVLTWNHVPMDVAYQVVADHVVQCCRRQREAADVISTTTTNVVPNELSTAVHMAAQRPGLLEFVTRQLELWDDGDTTRTRCDDQVGNDDDDDDPAEPFPGRTWADSVRRWVAREQQQQHGTAAAAAAAALRSNRKRPRHREAVSSTATASTSSSHLVRDRAASILRRHGAGTAAKMGAVPIVNPAESTSHVVSLEDMEAFLNQSGTAQTNSDTAAPSDSASRNGSIENITGADPTGADSSADGCVGGRWSLCEVWEPCAIGSLGRN